MSGTFADVHCPSCGAPAKYDIISGRYQCGHCGGTVGIQDAIAQKRGFRGIRQEKIMESAGKYRLTRANCSGCGAQVVFQEKEAMSTCAFCGRALVRKEYYGSQNLPELIIPFRITGEEARRCLEDWCGRNARRGEARQLRDALDSLTGVYLPYELVRGPVECRVSRVDGGKSYSCSGYVDNVFVNCSRQLDNLLLDGMEPFELDELAEFDFAWAAGQRIKVPDLEAKALQERVSQEVSVDYTPTVRKTLETKAVQVSTDAGEVLRLPVLLPVYYISAGDTLAAVNGQTGKVSVRAAKTSHYYFIPWWLKAILSTLLISAAAFLAFRLFGVQRETNLILTGALALFTIIVTLTAYSDTVRTGFRVETRRKIFTSSGGPLRRVGRDLVQDKEPIRKEVVPPVFFENLDGQRTPVRLRFTSPLRVLKTALISLVALFLPVIVALFLNGFDFGRLELGGSAVWFCIAVPVVPIYILKFARIDLYQHPWIYRLSPDGTKTRYRKKRESPFRLSKDTVKTILRALIVPPVSLGVWFAILSFCAMCYLTAFGFD